MADPQQRITAALMQQQKMSKEHANYRPGTRSAHCAICEHFESPSGCHIVAGQIGRQMLCDYFERTQGPYLIST